MHRFAAQEDICYDRDQIGEVVDGSEAVSGRSFSFWIWIYLHCGTHHRVKCRRGSQVNAAQESDNDTHTELGIQRGAQPGMDARPTT